MFDRLIRFVGSIKLAVPLLSTIISILIWATFYESQVGSATVQQEVYKSPWFGALMFLLAVNLGMSALSRYPWRGARKIGFALTHFGLIVIIAGSAGVIHLGMEGMLLVRTDSPASDRIRVEGDLLEVVQSDGTIKRDSIFIKQDGTVSPKYIGGLELESYTDNAVQTINFADGDKIDNPGVKLSLASERMGQAIERTLVVSPSIYSKVGLGPAELEIVKVNSDVELNQILHPKTSDQHPWGELKITTPEKQRSFDVKHNTSKTLRVGGLKISIIDFFPDFRLDRNNQPVTASEKFNNPALALDITSPTGKERWFAFGKADFPPVRTLISGEAIKDITLNYQVQVPQVKDYFKVIANQDNLYYAAKSSTKFKSGSLTLGEAVTPGWADFKITLKEYLPHTQIQRKIVPATDKQVQGTPALLVKTASGQETWLPWGEASAINDGEQQIYAAFSPKVYQLPFAIQLEDFIVDRNEGSESVAMWTSKIRIEDPQNNITEQRKVWMNNPTWYQGWKIAQASWNPGDLQQSTLQVKREPAWITALTWVGSGLVVLGLAVMFYAPALAKKFRQKSEQQESVATIDDSQGKELTAIS
ncbi:cytochrome c biogenesis protein ResB [Pleurocapsales cyanobacterium LEGE 10410]|nr:cytochrome c biogenesis protein ResB [Pleurocapsales cyanobacterium LEGE 10410]